MKHKAIYPGTFDPITLGHVNIAEKAAALFDEVIIGIADYTGKNTLFTIEERTSLCTESLAHLTNVKVESFTGLSVDFAKLQDCRVMIRGMRAVSDFEYELSLALTNKKISPDVETIFLVPSLRYLYLSSSTIRQLAELGGDLEGFVPACVQEALKARFNFIKVD